jgi:RNA polymerase sigma-70 factor (ECF subfamily)
VSHDDKGGFVRDVYLLHREELCRNIVRKFGFGFSEAEDIVQSAFVRFAAMESPESVENPRAFLYTASQNIAIDLKRHNQVAHKYTQYVAGNDAEITDSPGPERLEEGRQRLGIISRALWGMPKKRRQLLMMSRFDGLSYAEIGRRVGLSESVVRKHVSNALADCHRALEARS